MEVEVNEIIPDIIKEPEIAGCLSTNETIGYLAGEISRLRNIINNSATAPLQKEIDKWKASHDNQVKLRRMLMDRPDLKERAKLVSRLTEENQKLQKEIERLRGEVEKAFTEGYKSYHDPSHRWDMSRAKRVAEGKE